MNGILNLNKPAGATSHDMVYLLRRVTGIKKVGHTGTLDPDAEGVLPMLIGRATRVSDLLTADDKEYVATVQLGVVTDTYDMSGEVLSTCDRLPDEAQVREAAAAFVGTIRQRPPAFSAIKQNGQPLYKLARQGVAVTVPEREVTVSQIVPRDFDLAHGRFCMEVHCSKGTYIRSLCHDMGQRLGCGAAMAGLVRTRSGSFRLADAVPAERVRKMNPAELERLLLPVDAVFSDLPRLDVNGVMAQKVKNGLRMRPDQYGISSPAVGTRYRIYGPDGAFLCVSETMQEQGLLLLRQVKGFF